MDLQNLIQVVETALVNMNFDLSSVREPKEGQWTLKHTGATVWVDVFNFPTTPDSYYFRLISPLLAVPDKRKENFYEDVLELNHQTCDCAITKSKEWTYVTSYQGANDLTPEKAKALMDRLVFYSNDYYNKLEFKYRDCWLPKASIPGGETIDKTNFKLFE